MFNVEKSFGTALDPQAGAEKELVKSFGEGSISINKCRKKFNKIMKPILLYYLSGKVSRGAIQIPS